MHHRRLYGSLALACGVPIFRASQVKLPMAGTGRAGSPLAHGASRVAQTAEGVNAPDTSRVLAPYTPRR